MTKVINLSTGMEAFYSLSPMEAVNAAYEQFERKNWNFWTYPKAAEHAKVTKSGKCCYRGDWSAILQ